MVPAAEDVRLSGIRRAARGDNGEQHSGGALHIHTRTPRTLPTSRPLTFTWPHSHSQTLIHYTKEIEIELLNNFVRRNGVSFISAARQILNW